MPGESGPSQHARILESLPAALSAVGPEQVKRLVALVVEEITTRDRAIEEIKLRPEARPFFTDAHETALAPRDGRQGARSKAYDPLAWYASWRSS